MPSDYPQHERLHAVRVEHQAVRAFLQWLDANGRAVGQLNGEIVEIQAFSAILAEYLGIDEEEIEHERVMLLGNQRLANND